MTGKEDNHLRNSGNQLDKEAFLVDNDDNQHRSKKGNQIWWKLGKDGSHLNKKGLLDI